MGDVSAGFASAAQAFSTNVRSDCRRYATSGRGGKKATPPSFFGNGWGGGGGYSFVARLSYLAIGLEGRGQGSLYRQMEAEDLVHALGVSGRLGLGFRHVAWLARPCAAPCDFCVLLLFLNVANLS